MKSAVIRDGIVSNIIKGEIEGSVPLEGHDPQPRKGWSYDGEAFSPPPQPEEEPNAPIEPEQPSETMAMTDAAFYARFSDAEFDGIADAVRKANKQRKKQSLLPV